MDGRREPDPKPENENERIDEEIIDLTQVIEGRDDDDIIDLNDILEQPGQAPEETDEEVIPLVDAIPTEETAALSEDTDDEIIDLKDVATTLEASISEPEPEVPALPKNQVEPVAETDEDIIDLLDVTAEAVPAPTSSDDGADIIDLTDINAPAPTLSDDPELGDLESRAEAMLADSTDSTIGPGLDPLDIGTPEEAELPVSGSEAPALVNDPPEPIDLPSAAVPVSPVLPPEALPPTDLQVETALERVIEKIYGEKIEQMMIQTIEKTVMREIEKIKNALIEDSNGMDG